MNFSRSVLFHVETRVFLKYFVFACSFHGLSVPEDDIECESFGVFSINFLFAYENKYSLQVYLDNCTYKTVKKQKTDYLDENVFEN